MSFVEFFQGLIGTSGQYDFIYYIFGCAGALIVLDGIIRFIFGGLNNITGGGFR